MRYPQAVIIDPRKVLPSRHSIFIRGFPSSVKIEDIKDLFSKQCDEKCQIDFFSYSEDKTALFVAIRFESHDTAKKLLCKYDGEKIFGHKVEISWFKDIRKARKKVIENEEKYRGLLAQPNFDSRRRSYARYNSRRMNPRGYEKHVSNHMYDSPLIRHRVSSSDSSRSRSRSISGSRKSRRSRTYRRSASRHFSSSADSSRSSKSERSAKHFSASPPDRPPPRSSSSSSSDSSQKSVTGTHSYEYSANNTEKEVLQIALSACPAVLENSVKNVEGPSTPCSSPHRSPKRSRMLTDESNHTSKERSSKRKHKRHSRHHRSRKLSGRDQSLSPLSSSPKNCTEIFIQNETQQCNGKESMEHVSESGEVPLQHIFLPDEPPPAKSSEFVKDPSPPVSSIQSPPAPEPVVAERTDLPVQDSSASHKEENGDEDHLVTADTLDPTFSGSESKTAEVGTQVSLPDSTTDDFGESCIQLQFLSDQKLDEIIQRKRMIEAAYRLDCESYTVSVAHMIRQNPDLRERLSSSLRTLLEQRAKRSICELQDYIRQLGR